MRLVVSLTTIPSRARTLLPHTLRSLARQTRRPDAVYLCVPRVSRRGGVCDLPDLREFPGATVLPSEVDYGPATKLLPALQAEREPATRIVTADDDVEYAPDWLERLTAGSERHPDASVGFCGWNAGLLLCTGVYDLLYEDLADFPDGQRADVLEGWRGVLHHRGSFADDVFDYWRTLPREATLADDVWVAGYLASRPCAERGVKRRVVRYRPGERLSREEAARIWVDRGGAGTGALSHVGDVLDRNRRVAWWVFRK